MMSKWYCCCPIISPIFHSPLKPKLTTFSFRPTNSLSHHTTSNNFTWDDVVVQQQQKQKQKQNDSSDLTGFFDKVSICNRNSVNQSEFVPFVVDGQTLGYVHQRFSEHLRRFGNVFVFPQDGSTFGFNVGLRPQLSTPEDRTKALGDVIASLGEEFIPGIRNELHPVKSSFEMPEFFSLERAAAPYFGIKAYGVHMNGYVERDGQKYLWLAKRSKVKPTYPGKLDHLVAGGLPHGISCVENVIKECEEEAGIPRSISSTATPVGVVSYMDIDGYRFKRDVIFCYDLKLSEDFVPTNNDGEVESFKLVPVAHVANTIRSTLYFKDNCNIVIIDFLFRHGYIKPESLGYLKLLQSLRSGDCT